MQLFEIRTEEKGPRGGRRLRAYVVVAQDGEQARYALAPQLDAQERVTDVREHALHTPLKVRS